MESNGSSNSSNGCIRRQSDDDDIALIHHQNHQNSRQTRVSEEFSAIEISSAISKSLNSKCTHSHSQSNGAYHTSNASHSNTSSNVSNASHSHSSAQSTNHSHSLIDADNISEDTLIRCNHSNGTCQSPQDYRVKLYKLNDDGNWGDEGTGTIHFQLQSQITTSDPSGGSIIDVQVHPECDQDDDVEDGVPALLLQHTAQRHIVYEKQVESVYTLFFRFAANSILISIL